MSQDDIHRATIETVMLIADDRDGVKQAVTVAVGNTVGGSNGHLFLRLHPTAWKRLIPNVSAGLWPLSNEAQAAVQYVCNHDQDRDFPSISYSDVAGDFVCG